MSQQLLQLEAGNVYSLKVLEIRKRNKQITKKDQLLYDLYDITVQDREGKTANAEYVTREKDASAFVMGVFQYIRCGIVCRGTPEIEPADEPIPGAPPKGKPTNTETDNPLKGVEEKADINTDGNTYSVPVSGKSITFAMGMAKDILIQELANSGAKEATESDIQRMIRNANTINNAIVERVTF